MTHEGLTVLITVLVISLGAFGIGMLGFALWVVRDISRMTRAVAGLVYQEEEKTRSLLRETRGRQ